VCVLAGRRPAASELSVIDPVEMVRTTREFFDFPMCDRDPIPHWSFGRVTLHRAERQHTSPTSRTVASLVKLATGPNSSWFWASSPSPNGGSAQLVGYRPVLKSWRPGQADELG
jgi:hypothetical protein